MEAMPLEDVLAGKEPVIEPPTEEVATEEAQPEKAEATAEPDPTPEVEDSEPKGEIVEPPSTDDIKQVPLAAVLDERDKRKALQAELDDLRKAQEAAQPKVDFWENPDAAIDTKIEAVRSEMNQQFTNGYLQLSMAHSASAHDDFDAAKDAFIKAAEENPALADQVMQSQMPGEAIYKYGKEFLSLQKYGDVSTMEARIRQEERAKVLAELEAEKDATKTKLAAVPESLTSQTSASAPAHKVTGGPTPLESILNQR